ncbi:MAG: cyclodeaminase/cyclohydrolase family protein [Solirubrobacterales bacterium]
MPGLGASRVEDALEALASRSETVAAGGASVLCCAAAAALVELTAGLAAERLGAEGNRVGAEHAARLGGLGEAAAGVRGRLPGLADRDASLYAEVLAATDAEARSEALARASEVPLEVAETAAEVAEAAAEVVAAGSWPFTADARVACRLASAAAGSAAELVAANLGGGEAVERARAASERAQAACARLGGGREEGSD